MTAVSDFLPELKKQAEARLPAKYRNANLVVKTGDDNRVFWGGIGRRSLTMKPEDYLWTVVSGKKIFYSLDTFFQANLSILPEVIERLTTLVPEDPRLTFYDFYGGVGFFSVCLADRVGKVVLIEENVHACRVALFNFAHHRIANYEIIDGRMEDKFDGITAGAADGKKCVLVDPPRQGLSLEVASQLAETTGLDHIIYLSCHPETLARDIKIFAEKAWEVAAVIPFDFFPRTEHIETLVELRRAAGKGI